MEYVIIALSGILFACMYMMKGGWFGDWLDERDQFITVAFVSLYCFFMGDTIVTAILIGVTWTFSHRASMGEEVGAIGRIGRAWGEYVLHAKDFGRRFGVLKGVQRGIYPGALLALATGDTVFIIPGLLFVPLHFIGQELTWRFTKTDGWKYVEPFIGLAFGIAFGYHYT